MAAKKLVGYKLEWFKETDTIPLESEYITNKEVNGTRNGVTVTIYLFKVPVYA